MSIQEPPGRVGHIPERDEGAKSPEELAAEKEELKGSGKEGFTELWATMNGKDTNKLDEEYSPEMLAFMSKFEVMNAHQDSGGILVRFQDNDQYGIDVSPNGVEITGMSDEEMLTDAGLEAMIESAVMAKSLQSHEKPGLFVSHHNDEIAMALKKAGQMAGVNMINGIGDELDKANPDLAKRMEEAYARVQERHGGTLPGADAPSADADAAPAAPAAGNEQAEGPGAQTQPVQDQTTPAGPPLQGPGAPQAAGA